MYKSDKKYCDNGVLITGRRVGGGKKVGLLTLLTDDYFTKKNVY